MDLNEILGEELYTQVQEKLGDKKIIVNDGSYIPKIKFDEVNVTKKNLVTELENLKNQFKDNSELTKQIESMQLKEKELEKTYKRKEFELNVKLLANKENAVDEDDLLKFINEEDFAQ